jgi:hypothetical protein
MNETMSSHSKSNVTLGWNQYDGARHDGGSVNLPSLSSVAATSAEFGALAGLTLPLSIQKM